MNLQEILRRLEMDVGCKAITTTVTDKDLLSSLRETTELVNDYLVIQKIELVYGPFTLTFYAVETNEVYVILRNNLGENDYVTYENDNDLYSGIKAVFDSVEEVLSTEGFFLMGDDEDNEDDEDEDDSDDESDDDEDDSDDESDEDDDDEEEEDEDDDVSDVPPDDDEPGCEDGDESDDDDESDNLDAGDDDEDDDTDDDDTDDDEDSADDDEDEEDEPGDGSVEVDRAEVPNPKAGRPAICIDGVVPPPVKPAPIPVPVPQRPAADDRLAYVHSKKTEIVRTAFPGYAKHSWASADETTRLVFTPIPPATVIDSPRVRLKLIWENGKWSAELTDTKDNAVYTSGGPTLQVVLADYNELIS